MQGSLSIAGALDRLIGFALPPRCAGCGTIVEEMNSFCTDCWTTVDWLGTGCLTCGLPLEATDADQCGRCLAAPPVIARTRAAVGYGELTRTLPLRLKYARKVGLARTMARYMAPFVEPSTDAILVPVPLHRWRLWGRGFNQSVLLAREVGRQRGIPVAVDSLRRRKSTRPLKGMTPKQRQREVAGAFTVDDQKLVHGRTVILVDDVLTSGSTTDACARALLKAGATRIELICWARVVRPVTLMR